MKKIYVVYNHVEENNAGNIYTQLIGAFDNFEKAKKCAEQIASKKAKDYEKRYENIEVRWDDWDDLYVILSKGHFVEYYLESVRIAETNLNEISNE